MNTGTSRDHVTAGWTLRSWAWLRIAVAGVALSGVLAGLVVNIDRASRLGQDMGLVLANYFSLLTVTMSLLSAAVLLAAVAWDLRNPGTTPEPLRITLAMAAVAAPILIVGLVYNLLLRGPSIGVALGDSVGILLLDEYAVEVMHVVLPLFFVLDILFAPRRGTLPWWSLAVMVGYPLTWVTYTLVRGELVGNPDGSAPWWYPYPFLDPHGAGGYGSTFAYIGAILAAFLAVGAMIILVDRHRANRAATHRATPAAGAFPV